MFHHSIVAFTTLAFCSLCQALGQDASIPTVRALLLAPGGAVVKLHPLAGENVDKAILIGARGLSDPFKPASRAFSLALPDNTMESGYRSVAQIALPEYGEDFIILLEPAAEIFNVHIVNGKEPRFSKDCLLFFNAVETSLIADLGGSKILLKPRVATFAKPPPRGEKPFYQVTFYRPDNNQPRAFANTRWPHRDVAMRSYVFFYPNKSGRVTWHAVDERLSITDEE